jgi:hypothetical protein
MFQAVFEGCIHVLNLRPGKKVFLSLKLKKLNKNRLKKTISKNRTKHMYEVVKK